MLQYANRQLKGAHLQKLEQALHDRLLDQQVQHARQEEYQATLNDLKDVQSSIQILEQQNKEVPTRVKPVGKAAAKIVCVIFHLSACTLLPTHDEQVKSMLLNSGRFWTGTDSIHEQ